MAPIISPVKSFINIRSGMKSVISGLGTLTTKTVKLNSILLRKTKVKRESIAQNYILSQRREESARRKDREDIIESSSIGGVVNRQTKVITSSVKGFLGRILDFVGTLLVGWLTYNLPSIITMAKELIGRMQRLYTIATRFFNSTVNMFKGFGNVLGAIGKNILTFDFTDSKGRVNNAVKDLNGTFEDMQSQFDDAFKLLTTSLGEGIVTGENAQPFGTEYQNGSMQEPYDTPSSGGGTSTGTPEQRAMLDSIAFAEGTRDRKNNGYNTMFTGKQFSGYADHPRKVNSSNGYSSDAAGRYQFLSTTWDGLAKKLGLKDFSPESQDKAAIELAREYGVTQELLSKEGMSPRVSALLGRQWASFPGKTIGLDQPTQKLNSIQTAYKKSLGTPQAQPTQRTPTPAQTSQAVSTSVVDQFKGKPGGAAGIITSERGMRLSPTSGQYKMHNGIDIAPAGPGYYVALKLSGTISDVSLGYSGGYGNYVDIKSGNTIYRFAHLARVMVKRGKPYNGQTIGEIGSTGGSTGIHLHFEVRPGGGDSINPRPYLGLLSIGKNLSGAPGQPTQIATPTPAQIASPATQQRRQTPQNLTQNKPGPTVVVLEEDAPPAQQSQVSVGGGGIIPIIINPLNSFITQKLLLDLAYT